MGCAASKAPPKRDPVEELIEEAHAHPGVHDAERRREPARGRVEINLHAIEPT